MSRRRLAVAVLVLMGLAFVAYAILHSPLRHRIDRLFGAPPGCTVLCGHTSQMIGRLDVLFFLAAALVAAWAVVSVVGLRSWERPAAWGLVAFAFVSVPAAIVGEAASLAHSHLLRPPYGPLIASLPALVAIWLLYRRGWRPAMPRIEIRPIAPLVALMAIPVLGLIAISMGVAVSHPPTGYDELGYHAPLAVFYWRSGDLSSFMDAIPGKFTLAHPGSAELLFGALRLIAGEPAAILGQLPFALLGAAGVAAFARRLGLSAGACAVAAVIFLGAPIVALQVGRQANDVVGASLIIVVAALAAAPPEEWSIGRAALIGLGLGVAAVTKLALLPLVFALVLVVLGTLIIRARRSGKNLPEAESPFTRRQALISLAVLAGCFLVAVAPWWIRNVMLFGNPIYPAAIPLIGRGVSFGEGQPAKDLVNVPHTWLWPLYLLFEPLTHASGMGAAFAIGIVPGALAAALLARRRPLIILLVLVVVGIPAWWMFSRHEPRFLLSLAGLAAALVPFTLLAARHHWRAWAGGLLTLAVLFTAGATVTADLSVDASKPEDRLAFYDRTSLIDPAVTALPEETGLFVDLDCTMAAFNRIYPFLGTSGNRQIAELECGSPTDTVISMMRKFKLQDVYAVRWSTDSAQFDAIYPPDRFQLVSQDLRRAGHGTRMLDRRIYRLLDAPS